MGFPLQAWRKVLQKADDPGLLGFCLKKTIGVGVGNSSFKKVNRRRDSDF